MDDPANFHPPSRSTPATHQRSTAKLARLPIHVEAAGPLLPKPAWLRIRLHANPQVAQLRQLLREQRLHTVCEEAACPNVPECFGHGTATFMILGDLCTRRCPFCDVAHGKPLPPDVDEPQRLAAAIAMLSLRYVVITSVDRDDLRDGGAGHFAACIQAIRNACPEIRIEVLTPDFRGRLVRAIAAFDTAAPDVFNHNLETVPRLYPAARPGADYQTSLTLLARFKQQYPGVATKSGLMLGLGETLDEVLQVMDDLRQHHCDMLTIGQYLAPSRGHHPVMRYATPEEFGQLRELGERMGFAHVASGPLVRSSYHADQQAAALQETNTAVPSSAT